MIRDHPNLNSDTVVVNQFQGQRFIRLGLQVAEIQLRCFFAVILCLTVSGSVEVATLHRKLKSGHLNIFSISGQTKIRETAH